MGKVLNSLMATFEKLYMLQAYIHGTCRKNQKKTLQKNHITASTIETFCCSVTETLTHFSISTTNLVVLILAQDVEGVASLLFIYLH